jgi:hypothetical protein
MSQLVGKKVIKKNISKKNIEFIKNNIGMRLMYDKKTGTYHDWKNRYTIAECMDGRVDEIIRQLDLMKRKGHKVMCLDGIVNDIDYKNAVEKNIEVVDDDTVREIEANLRIFKMGMNIPAMGYGALKIRLLNNLKEWYGSM